MYASRSPLPHLILFMSQQRTQHIHRSRQGKQHRTRLPRLHHLAASGCFQAKYSSFSLVGGAAAMIGVASKSSNSAQVGRETRKLSFIAA